MNPKLATPCILNDNLETFVQMEKSRTNQLIPLLSFLCPRALSRRRAGRILSIGRVRTSSRNWRKIISCIYAGFNGVIEVCYCAASLYKPNTYPLNPKPYNPKMSIVVPKISSMFGHFDCFAADGRSDRICVAVERVFAQVVLGS